MIFKRVLVVISCIFLLSVVAIAVPDEVIQDDFSISLQENFQQVEPVEAVSDVDLLQDLIINDSVSGQHVIEQLIVALGERQASVVDNEQLILTSVDIRSVAPVQPSDTSGLKAALLGILGDYDPVVVEYQYQNNNGTYSYVREIQPDYVWLCSCALIVVVMFCLFKIGGAALSRR